MGALQELFANERKRDRGREEGVNVTIPIRRKFGLAILMEQD
jgi:hypothetical protein